MFQALGLVETLGSADAVIVVDKLLKTAEVSYETQNTRCGGHVTVFVSGDVAAVTEAIEAVRENPPCAVIDTAVISNPSEEAERLVLEQKGEPAPAAPDAPAEKADAASEEAEKTQAENTASDAPDEKAAKPAAAKRRTTRRKTESESK